MRQSGLFVGCGQATFQELKNRVLSAEAAFGRLPAATRSRMDNDPAKLLAFLADPKNKDEAVKLGLVHPPAKSVPTPIPNPPTPTPPGDETSS